MTTDSSRSRSAAAVLRPIAFIGLVLAALPAMASVTFYQPRTLREQWDRARHVALVRITSVKKLGEVGPLRPLGPCGVLYGIEVLDRFKGELPRQAAFATHQILFPERPLRVEEEALIFLRDLRSRQPLDRGIQQELDAAAEAIAECGPMPTTLYVARSEENVFPLISDGSGRTGEVRWLEYRATPMPADIQPRRERTCKPSSDAGCVVRENPRVAWPPLRALLKSFAAADESPRQPTPVDARFVQRLIEAAEAQTAAPVTYDGSYRRMPYPGGDVPASVGVCTDLIIRAYRAVGVDLQVRVHEDMSAAFGSYPQLWGLSRPDPNIDHRRVPNLQTYFRRRGEQLPISRDADDYLPGDLVTWILPGNLPHIGLVTDRRSSNGDRWLIVHNIGRGPEIEDMLFGYPISGHYRYRGDR